MCLCVLNYFPYVKCITVTIYITVYINFSGEDGVKELCMSPLLPDIIVSMISMLQQDEYLLIQGYHVLPAPAKICFRKHQLYEAIESLQV